MITLSNGHRIEFLAASGALAFDGRGWPWERPWLWSGKLNPEVFTIVLKTLKLYRHTGHLRWWNGTRVVKWLPNGTVNSIGLTGPGLLHWIEHTLPQLNSKWRYIISITASTAVAVEVMGRLIRFAVKNKPYIVGVQFNASCPNSPGEAELLENTDQVVALVRAFYHAVHPLPLLLKLSAQQNCLTIVRQLSPLIEAVELNSVPWALAFPGAKSPLAKRFGAGGVSGKAAQAQNWKAIERLTRENFESSCVRAVPIIGCSVWEYEDLEQLRSKGVQAVAFGALFLKKWHGLNPTLPNQYVARWRKGHERF